MIRYRVFDDTAKKAIVPAFAEANHYTGFPDRADTSLSWDNGTYTLTLTASADVVWIDGTKYTINSLTKQLSVSDEAATGLYWFWITAPGGVPQLNYAATPPGFDKCLTATVYWNTGTSAGILNDERHWFGRDQKMHEYLHDSVGARYASGMAGTFGNTTFQVEAGEFYDEDISHNPAQQTTAKVLYHNGDSAWAWDTLSTPYKVVNPGVDNTLRYNNGNALASVGTSKYTCSWVYVSGDPSHPIHIYIGDAEYNTVALARAATPLSRGILTSPEDKLLYKVIYQNSGGSPVFVETEDYRTSQSLSSVFVATDHGALSGLSDNDHPQYELVSSLSADISANSDVTLNTAMRKIQSISATAGGTTTFDLTSGHNALITMGAGNTTINFTNPPASGYCFHIPIRLKQDSTGSRTISGWQVSGNAVTPSGTVTLSTAANAVDRLHAVLWNVSGTYYIDLLMAYKGIA